MRQALRGGVYIILAELVVVVTALVLSHGAGAVSFASYSAKTIGTIKEDTVAETTVQSVEPEEPIFFQGSDESWATGVLTREKGINYYGGRRETYYSQRVLPGGGLDIPGRHVEESDGTIRDVDDYICVAADDLEYGTVIMTSLGIAKVYDCGVGYPGGTDIYVDW